MLADVLFNEDQKIGVGVMSSTFNALKLSNMDKISFIEGKELEN